MLQALVALLPALAAAGTGDFPITWAGDKYELEELPETLAANARETAKTWAPWAEEVGYRMDFSADGRVLLMTFDDSRGRRKSEKNMELIEEVLKRVDALLPLPPSRTVEASTPKPDDGSYEWGRVERETQTAVLIEADEEEHHEAAVDFAAGLNSYLGTWAAAAKPMTGFVLEQPLAAEWQPKAGIKEDWEGKPVNEMVNRLSQLMTLRRFGRQPYWLSMGIAWHVEMEQLDGVYCFPYRHGFVSSSEHDKWDKALRNEYKHREGPVAMSELTALQRGTFDPWAAKKSWAAVTLLARHYPEALPEICEDLYELWDEQGRETHADGTWTRIDGFEPSDADQLAVFEKHVPGFATELQRFFTEGKDYEKP